MSTHGSDESDKDLASSEVDLTDLIRRAQVLSTELEKFYQYLRDVKQERVATQRFGGTVKSELALLERIASEPEGSSVIQRVRSSNFPFLEALWTFAKGSKDLIAIEKKFSFSSGVEPAPRNRYNDHNAIRSAKKGHQTKCKTVVHVVADSGMTWMKLSLITNTRMLFDLAKQGWTGISDDEYSDGDMSENDEESDVPLLKMVKDLVAAAAQSRIRTRKPTVHLVLPRIKPGEHAAIDAVLRKCRDVGAIISFQPLIAPSLSLDESFKRMAPQPIPALSDTLNIDCTILLAIISDFSHAKVAKEPWFHPALQQQVEVESSENLMPSFLYPCMGSRQLVCTQEAAVRMREIIETLGTPSEAARSRILMGNDSSQSQAEAVAEMQKWSAYDVPADWQLPIRVVQSNEGNCHSKLSPEALQASISLTPINKSVFLHGWATGRTTVTSNRTVVQHLESELNKFQDLDESSWPKYWLCPHSRSLVGKQRRNEKREVTGSTLLLPDPLLREQWRRHGLDELSRRQGHEVEDLMPNGIPCAEILEAKNASMKSIQGKLHDAEDVKSTTGEDSARDQTV